MKKLFQFLVIAFILCLEAEAWSYTGPPYITVTKPGSVDGDNMITSCSGTQYCVDDSCVTPGNGTVDACTGAGNVNPSSDIYLCVNDAEVGINTATLSAVVSIDPIDDDVPTGWTVAPSNEFQKSYATEIVEVIRNGVILSDGTNGFLGANTWDWASGILYMKEDPANYSGGHILLGTSATAVNYDYTGGDLYAAVDTSTCNGYRLRIDPPTNFSIGDMVWSAPPPQ